MLLTVTTAYAGSNWEYRVREDKMSGEKTDYIVGVSNNKLTGWLDRKSHVFLFVVCESHNIQIQVDNIGFHRDSVDLQYSRIKFDNNKPQKISFNVDDDNNDLMRFTTRGPFKSSIEQEDIISSMKSGITLYLEISPFNTKGKEQIAEFDLRGFTAAINQCKGVATNTDTVTVAEQMEDSAENPYYVAKIILSCNENKCMSFILDIKNKSEQNLEVDWSKTYYLRDFGIESTFTKMGYKYFESPEIIPPKSSIVKSIYPGSLAVKDEKGQWIHTSMTPGLNGVDLTVIVDGSEVKERLSVLAK
jgi:hypothetical protein